ncbi:MAG: hypothetical protein ACUZ8H_01295 [Candidatus Anammoxibacter sp.]
MDDDISNINNITPFHPYDGKNEPQRKSGRKKKKHEDQEGVQDEDSITDTDTEESEHEDSDDDNVGHNIDVDM